MRVQDVLLAYSEWLDGEGLMSDHAIKQGNGDDRTHEDLVSEFAKSLGDTPLGAFMDRANEGRAGAWLGLATTMDLITELNARAAVSLVAGEDWPKYRTVGA